MVIRCIPKNSIPKPVTAVPTCLSTFFFANSNIITPIAIAMGAKELKLRETSTLVVVVPMFAPIITPIAWVRFIMPVLTKPTTITVVAVEL